MTRMSIRSRTLAWALAVSAAGIFLLANTTDASAQNNSCCTFMVTISNSLNGICPSPWSIPVTTNWGLPVGTSQTNVKTDYKRSTYDVNGCPPLQNFNWVSLDGGTTTVSLATSPAVIGSPCGPVCASVLVNGDGCIEIRISALQTPCP